MYADKETDGDARGDRRDRPPPRDPASPTTRSTGSRRRRSSRASPTSPSSCRPSRKVPQGPPPPARDDATTWRRHEIEKTIVELEEEMLAAAEELRFEYAAKLRDEIRELRRELDEADRAGRVRRPLRPVGRGRPRGVLRAAGRPGVGARSAAVPARDREAHSRTGRSRSPTSAPAADDRRRRRDVGRIVSFLRDGVASARSATGSRAPLGARRGDRGADQFLGWSRGAR